MTYNYFNELKNSFEKCAYVYSDGYDDGGRSDRALADAASSGVEDALAAATGATADVGRVADTVEETGGAVQKSLDELTPAATGALDALKWAPVALAGIPTAGYLLHQYLRGNYDDKKKKEKEAAYLGKRAMEKAGQRWISKAFAPSKWIGESAAANPIRGRILPALGAGGIGYGASEATDSPFIGGAAAYGTYGLLSPRAIARMKGKALGEAAASGNWPKGMTPDEAYNKGLTKGMTPKELMSAGMNEQVMKGLAMKGGLMAAVGAGEYAGPLLSNVERATRGAAEQMEADKKVILSWTLKDGTKQTRQVPADWLEGQSGGSQGAVSRSNQTAKQRFQAGTLPGLIESGEVTVTDAPTFAEAGQKSMQKLEASTTDAAEFMEEALPVVGETAKKALPLAKSLERGMKSQAYEAQRWREGLSGAVRKAAPVGAGALGGYILSQLLGPGVRKNETPSEREKRERLQRIYSLLGTTGGGALGYYLANRLGGAGAGANTKTGGDVKSFKTIARLGRASA